MTEKLSDLLKLHQDSCELVSSPDNDVVLDPHQLADLSLRLSEAIKIVKAWEDAAVGTVELYQTQHDGDDPFIEFEIRGSIECPTTYAGKRYKLVEVE